jgi:membrane associated rhomboid family serine protease
MITIKKDFKDIPVSTFIGVSIIIIFILFNLQIIKTIPCGNNIHEVFITNFVHINLKHLVVNLYALYTLSRVEQEMGLKSFIWLIIFLLLFNTLIEFIIRIYWKNIKCSIGFSGILFGIVTWEIASKRKIDIEMILAIIIMVIVPSLQNKKASIIGHFIGALSGIIGGFLWKFINKKN